MLIIVEGVDGSGKSTLVEKLAGYLGDCLVLHAAQPKGNWVEEYVNPLLGYRPAADDQLPTSPAHIICDRWHWGELIYGPLYRGTSILDDEGVGYMDSLLHQLGALMVHLWNTEDVILERWATRGEDFLKPEHLRDVIRQYHELANMSRVPVLNAIDPPVHSVLNLGRTFEVSAAERFGVVA